MIKTDDLGTYDDEEIPEGMNFPLNVDIGNMALASGDNSILMLYAQGSTEASYQIKEQRKAEFVARAANGDFMILQDKKGGDHVYRRVKRTLGKNGNIVCEFEEVKKAVTANG